MSQTGYSLETVVSAPFSENSYVAWIHGSDEALVVDPGFDLPAIGQVLNDNHLKVVAILNTHGHVDHIVGNRALKESYPNAPLIIGENEVELLISAEANHSAKYGLPITSPPPDRTVKDGEILEVAGFKFEVREIPGHSPGSVVFICHDFRPKFAIVGDVLFAGSIGRTDFGGGSESLLIKGIHEKLMILPDDTIVHAGHMESTTIGQERRTNPFVGGKSY